MKTLLFIVDMQNDFCSPQGSLYVPGAEMDAERLGRLIDRRKEDIDKIILTLDQHHVMDIAHPFYWHDERGEHPKPFTAISWWEVLSGEWIPICPSISWASATRSFSILFSSLPQEPAT